MKKIIENPIYIGKITYGKTVNEKVKGTRDQYHRVAVDDYMVTDGLHEPIIDHDTWEKARDRRNSISKRYRHKGERPHEYLLTGLLKCPKCGAGLAGTVRRRTSNKTGDIEEDYFYRCTHRAEVDGKKCDLRISINEDKINKQVENIILDMSKEKKLSGLIMEKLSKNIDVDELNNERNQLIKQLRQASGAKDKLLETFDALDVTDKHYDKKYDDMQKRLEKLYDRITSIESSLAQVEGQISDVNNERLTVTQLNEILKNFDKVYYKMTAFEKRKFLNTLIERVEVYEEKTDEGYLLKEIEFKFPLNYADDGNIWLHNEKTVETVAMLDRK